MARYYGDFHIHLGRTKDGAPVKITAAKDLTLPRILEYAVARKGLELVGVIDALGPKVLSEIEEMLSSGEMVELAEGGLRYRDKITLLLGAELETREKAHFLCYFPRLEHITAFSLAMSQLIKNIGLSTQNCHITAQQLWERVHYLQGVMIPAHVFTPFKSLYGICADSIARIFSSEAIRSIPAIELGLSSDTELADHLPELNDMTFLSNSDAHSLDKIAREFNEVEIEQPSYKEWLLALKRQKGRRVTANFGLDPKLGKYHRTFCHRCEEVVLSPPPAMTCPKCGGDDITKGVLDRIVEIGRQETCHPEHRPPYYYQVPLSFLPKVGQKTAQKLIEAFGSERAVLHEAKLDDLTQVVGLEIANNIVAARQGRLTLLDGGGGRYGRVSHTTKL